MSNEAVGGVFRPELYKAAIDDPRHESWHAISFNDEGFVYAGSVARGLRSDTYVLPEVKSDIVLAADIIRFARYGAMECSRVKAIQALIAGDRGRGKKRLESREHLEEASSLLSHMKQVAKHEAEQELSTINRSIEDRSNPACIRLQAWANSNIADLEDDSFYITYGYLLAINGYDYEQEGVVACIEMDDGSQHNAHLGPEYTWKICTDRSVATHQSR